MLKRLFFILIVFYTANFATAEPLCHIVHYSTEDGLPQYNIMDMIQDKKGFMWFATWDGLSKFDGYGFKNFKAQQAEKYFMRSNRIDRLHEDKYGRIWFRSYDGDTHCFNPATEQFWGLQSLENAPNDKIENIEFMPSGKIWLIIENNGCMLLKDSIFALETFNVKNQQLKSNKVNSILEEKDLTTWILTNNGIVSISPKNEKKTYFNNGTERDDNQQAFFKGIEFRNEIWFGSQNGRIWRISKSSSKNNLMQLPLQSDVVDFRKISETELCIVSRNQGFVIYNSADNSLKTFNTSNLQGLLSNEINIIHIDKNKNLWFETNSIGINRLNLKTNDYKFYKVGSIDLMTFVSPPIALVVEDINGRLWIQPKGGGFSLYNSTTDTLEPFFNSPMSENWRFSNTIYSGFSDKQGNLWLSTHSHGLEKIIFDNSYFTSTPISKNKYPKTANEVRAVFEDADLNFWVSTKDRKLTLYDKNRKKLGELAGNGSVGNGNFMPAIAYSIIQDANKNIWVGTKGAGVFVLKKTENPLKYDISHYSSNSDVYSLSNNSVYSIFQDSNGRIWIGTYGGGLNMVEKPTDGTLKFINNRNHLRNYPIETASQVRFVTQTKNKNICFGTTGGMLMFSSSFSSPENIEFRRYTVETGNKNSITNNDVHGICNTRKGEMFLFTFGGGINKAISFDKQGFPTVFKAYTSSDGLPSDVTLGMVEDEFGKLWISTENSLTRFDPELETFKTYSEIRKLMINSNFSEVSMCRLENNDIVFGYSDGLLSFSPKNIVSNNYKPYIAFTNFQLFNKNVAVGGDKSPLKTTIDNQKKLKLTHKQKFFNIEYAALDYLDPANILYAYKLEGFDEDWNYVQKQRIANYTNIPKGKYVFKVKSTNSDGDWVENERDLPIEVLPSFWETNFAKFLYFLIIIGLLYLLMRIVLTIYHLKANVELEKKMSDLKLRFFTDISHEIRTPLTMIAGPVDYMLNDSKTPENIKHQLKVVSQNSNRMLHLVNQVLDLRKIQFTNLKVQEIALADFTSKICDNFSEIAEKQQIEFNFQDSSKNAKVWLDPDSAEKIIMNLLSNAFKYTPSGKSINVLVKEDDKNVSVEIKDEGVGISKEKQKKLFTRFVTFSDDKIKPSTGIGLNMVKELVDKHAAKVSLESEEGKGSVFTVSFQKGFSHFSKDVEIIATGNKETVEESTKKENPVVENVIATPKTGKQSILIVEDDADLRTFIRTILEGDYHVIEAEDGVDGMNKALKHCPDFIVSDIMMPRMDGVELLQSLRSELTTSHIPVILLTAKSTIESKLEGLQYGADDYITKPFSVTYFRARIANLLQQRKKLQQIYRESFIPNSSEETHQLQPEIKDYQPQTVVVASHDDIMMKKIMELIEENMDNSDFSVEEMGQHAGMSRSVFFKKLKSLTGLSPVEFVRDIKMKRAAQLLSTGQLMVKEVASQVGISDTRYFAKCFKAKYGMIPQDYKNKMAEEK